MSQVRWKLKEALDARGVTTYKLAQKLRGRVGRNTVHAAARGEAGGVQFDTLAAILDGIKELTGQPAVLADVIEIVPDAAENERRLTAAGVPYTGDAETDAVLNAHPDILERVGRLERGEVGLIPITEVAARLGLQVKRAGG